MADVANVVCILHLRTALLTRADLNFESERITNSKWFVCFVLDKTFVDLQTLWFSKILKDNHNKNKADVILSLY